MTTRAAEPGPFIRLAIDLGPLLLFLFANRLLPGEAFDKLWGSTAIFMVATLVAMGIAKLKLGKVSPLLLISGAMVLVFGGLTLALRSETFIKVKPTFYYVTCATILGYSLWSGKPALKLVLGQAYPGLSQRGWTLLSRNWALFFLAAGIANEAVWRTTTTDFWLGYKLWGVMPATLIFAVANLPMLMKHGLTADRAEDDPPLPPQG
ncbi:MAG: septation protein IspZ [Sphingomonas fennica]